MHSILGFIQDSVGPAESMKIDWNDKFPARSYVKEIASLENKIADISRRGIVALTIGCAEWVVWRLSKLSDDPVPYFYLQAGWLSIVDWLYFNPEDRPRAKDWTGSVRGPLCASTAVIRKSILQASRDKPCAYEAVSMSNLAILVLDEPGPFKKWRDATIDRLADLYPRNADDPIGVPVPREFLDPDVDPDLGASEGLLKAFLEGVDQGGNPYLRSGEEIKDLGFSGEPYRL